MTDATNNPQQWAHLDPMLNDERAMFSAARVRELLVMHGQAVRDSLPESPRLSRGGDDRDTPLTSRRATPAAEDNGTRVSSSHGALGPLHLRAVRFAQMASCTCLTKTPDIQYHKADCRYRLFAEIERYLSGTVRSTAQDMLNWARENESLLNSGEFDAIDRAVQRFLVQHGAVEGAQQYECIPKNGGNRFIIDRAPDSWELRECDIQAVAGVVEKSVDVWEPAEGEDVAVCLDNALARTLTLLLLTRNTSDYLYASRLQYIRKDLLPLVRLLAGEPDVALLCSMATCLNHGFGLLNDDRQRVMLDDMRKLYDEVVGKGYYRLENRSRYTEYLAATVKGGERTTEPLNVDRFAPRLAAPPADATQHKDVTGDTQ